MINFKQLFAPSQPDGSYEDAARRQAMADALQKQAMQPRGPAPGGPVQAQYGIGEGLTQLAQALLARRAGKSAVAAKTAADTKQRGVNDQTLQTMLPPSQMQAQRYAEDGSGAVGSAGQVANMDADALSMALSGMDPQKVAGVLAEKQMGRLLPDASEVADRELKKYQIGVTMADKEQARADQMERLQMQIAAEERAGRDSNALRAQLAQMQADSRIQAAEIAAAASRDSAASRQDAKADAANEKQQGRLAALEATKGALARVQATSNTLGDGGGFIEGRIPAIGPVAQDFDGAKAQLLATIQSALRVPGIGSQSNMELQALMAALPERTQEKTVRDNQIKGIAQRLETIISRESGMADAATPPTDSPAAPTGGISFATEAEAEAAAAAGRLKPGTKVTIGGVSGTWQ